MGTSTGQFLIYGATGYTGELVTKIARARNMNPILSGRNENRLRSMASQLDLPFRTAPLEGLYALDAAVREVDLVLNLAGPFSRTAAKISEICLRNGKHYLDVTGELNVFRDLNRKHERAVAKGVMLLPGVGFAIAPSDSLAASLRKDSPQASSLVVAISRPDFVSRGSARTILELIDHAPVARRHGTLQRVPAAQICREFDFGVGPVPCVAISWPDVFTAAVSSGFSDIEVYAQATDQELAMYKSISNWSDLLQTSLWQSLLDKQAGLLPGSPAETTVLSPRMFVAETYTPHKEPLLSRRLKTPDGYSYTAQIACNAVSRVLAGELSPGFQTPTTAFGIEFGFDVDGIELLS